MTISLDFNIIAARAGFAPDATGRLNLPATQETADALGVAALDIIGPWTPGDAPISATLTGAGPVWGHLAIAHAVHGRVAALTFAAPNIPGEGIRIFSHGVAR